ncbi:Hypothetical predicted protein [Cloeon dipterum]|uniref:Uncharacterized protein n=1 Tax=Cloeon dipterum TaxID=197152 RepID=A0A8S1CPS8_9INSE|nr:Hypothetical predicted protein [Cloeon dipterum]
MEFTFILMKFMCSSIAPLVKTHTRVRPPARDIRRHISQPPPSLVQMENEVTKTNRSYRLFLRAYVCILVLCQVSGSPSAAVGTAREYDAQELLNAAALSMMGNVDNNLETSSSAFNVSRFIDDFCK